MRAWISSRKWRDKSSHIMQPSLRSSNQAPTPTHLLGIFFSPLPLTSSQCSVVLPSSLLRRRCPTSSSFCTTDCPPPGVGVGVGVGDNAAAACLAGNHKRARPGLPSPSLPSFRMFISSTMTRRKSEFSRGSRWRGCRDEGEVSAVSSVSRDSVLSSVGNTEDDGVERRFLLMLSSLDCCFEEGKTGGLDALDERRWPGR